MDLSLLALLWCGVGMVWPLSAWLLSRRVRRSLSVSDALILTVVVFLGPCGVILFALWLWVNHGPYAPPTADEVAAQHESDLRFLRLAWDDDRLAVPQLVDFAEILEGDKRVDEALAVLQRAIDLCPADAELWRRKGRMHWRLGQRHEEHLAYSRAIELRRG